MLFTTIRLLRYQVWYCSSPLLWWILSHPWLSDPRDLWLSLHTLRRSAFILKISFYIFWKLTRFSELYWCKYQPASSVNPPSEAVKLFTCWQPVATCSRMRWVVTINKGDNQSLWPICWGTESDSKCQFYQFNILWHCGNCFCKRFERY